MQVITLFLDLLPDFIPFSVQTNKADGTAVNPTVDTLAIYEENGADAVEIVAADEIGNSPFDPIQIPTDGGLTGWWNIMIAKSNFSAGKFYLLRWQMTVDGIITAKTEMYYFINATQLMANVANLDAAVSTRATVAALATHDGKLDTVDTKADVIIAGLANATYGLSALKTLIDAIDTSTELQARFTEIKGSGWTDETLKAIKELVEAIETNNITGVPN